MRFASVLLIMFLGLPGVLTAATQGPGQAHQKNPARQAAEAPARVSEKGIFVLEPAIPGNNLRVGANSMDLMLRDKSGRGVEGAKLVVIPWSPDMGYGVWEKPTVMEKGDGNYHIENISIIRSGRWELKVSVKSGAKEDRAVFSYAVASKEKLPSPKPGKTKGGYSRTMKQYTVPAVTLLNQDGKRVNLKSLTDSGKPVIVNFIYTTCTTICPVLSASFTNLRRELGPDLEKVQFISISIDPEHDRPEQMKKYLSRFTTQKGWDFLTGSREEINRVLKAFDAAITDKMSHEPLYLLHGPQSDEWVRIKGLTWSADLMNELRSVEN